MKFIKSIFLYFKRMLNNKKDVKLIAEATKININDEKENFKNLLKYRDEEKRNNKKIETLICPGDGLGIQNKVSY